MSKRRGVRKTPRRSCRNRIVCNSVSDGCCAGDGHRVMSVAAASRPPWAKRIREKTAFYDVPLRIRNSPRRRRRRRYGVYGMPCVKRKHFARTILAYTKRLWLKVVNPVRTVAAVSRPPWAIHICRENSVLRRAAAYTQFPMAADCRRYGHGACLCDLRCVGPYTRIPWRQIAAATETARHSSPSRPQNTTPPHPWRRDRFPAHASNDPSVFGLSYLYFTVISSYSLVPRPIFSPWARVSFQWTLGLLSLKWSW